MIRTSTPGKLATARTPAPDAAQSRVMMFASHDKLLLTLLCVAAVLAMMAAVLALKEPLGSLSIDMIESAAGEIKGDFAIFTVAALALLLFVYVAAVDFMERQTEETIDAEVTGLREQYRDLGISGLGQIVAQRAAAETNPESTYLLVDDAGWPIAGNLPVWPEWDDPMKNRVRFSVDSGEGLGPRRFLGREFEFSDAKLLVARDIEDKLRTQSLVVNAIGLGSLLMLVFGVIGSLVMSR